MATTPSRIVSISTTPALKREQVSIVSPLRYPGSKRRFAHYVKEALALNNIRPKLFVELFAGGASVALQLLKDNAVEKIALIDRDPLVASFWQTVFFDTEWLVRQVETIEVTLKEWKRWKACKAKNRRWRALKCLFLNRTSFSGIIAPCAGPIGGMAQKSEYDISCRFPRKTLVRRITQAASLADRVAFVWCRTWVDSIGRIVRMQDHGSAPLGGIFLYLDPPFFEKADRLYTYYFNDEDHAQLRDYLLEEDADWILSYDSARKVEELYGSSAYAPRHVDLLYSTSGIGGMYSAREVVLSNLKKLPSATRLWRRNAEWYEQTSIAGRVGVQDNMVSDQALEPFISHIAET